MVDSKRSQVVVVTGATAGIGRAVVRNFARQGARIGLLARGREGLEATRREAQEAGGEALSLPTDVADADQVEAAAVAVERQFGPIVHGTLSALRRMVPRNRGTVVQVGSALAYRAVPLQAAYCGAKHAIRGFTDSVRCELLHEGSQVHLSMVQLPGLNTPQFRWAKSHMPMKAKPVPPIFQPEVAAEAVAWAAKHHPRELTVGLNSSIVINGQKLAPSLADRYLARTGIQDQLTDEPEDPGRANNLWEPVPSDHGAHGVFDDQAKSISYQLKLRKHRWLALGLAAGTAGAVALLVSPRGR